MSEQTKYETKKGQGQLMHNDPEWVKEKAGRPTHWGKFVIPEGAKAGDEIKLSGWLGTSSNDNPILKLKGDLKPDPTQSSNNEDMPF